jgi:hypothetical protein
MQDVPRANPELTVRDIGDETIILSEKGDMLHTLNAVAAFLWRHIDGEKTVRQILAALLQEYEVSEEAAKADLLRLLEELQEKKLVQVGGK